MWCVGAWVCAPATRYVWPFGTPSQLSDKALTSHSSEVRRALFVKKHGTVISGGADGLVQVWDAANGQRRFQMNTSHTGSLTTMAVDEVGERLITCADDGHVVAWTLHNGQHLRTIDACGDITRAVQRRAGHATASSRSGVAPAWSSLLSAVQSRSTHGGGNGGANRNASKRFLSDLCFANVSSSQE